MRNFRCLMLGLVLLSLAGVSWGEEGLSRAAAGGDAENIGVSANGYGTWFAFTTALGAGVIHYVSNLSVRSPRSSRDRYRQNQASERYRCHKAIKAASRMPIHTNSVIPKLASNASGPSTKDIDKLEYV